MSKSLHDCAFGVVGAGVMGAGIAQVLAVSGAASVICVDSSAPALVRAEAEIRSGRFGLENAVARGRLTSDGADAACAAITFADNLNALANTDLVLEAVFEDFGLKLRLFRELDEVVEPGAVFASNTSGFPLAAVASATNRPSRVIGWHWASPAPVQKMAEIVRTEHTSPDVVAWTVELATACGKNPVVVNDNPMAWGFVANRIFRAAAEEARRIVSEGVCDEAGVDQLMKDCFRWPAGPFELSGKAQSNWGEG